MSLADIVEANKKEYTKLYKNKMDINNKDTEFNKEKPSNEFEDTKDQTNYFIFTANETLFNPDKETDITYRIRVPRTKGQYYIDVPKEFCVWIDKDKTCQCRIPLENQLVRYNKTGTMDFVTAQELKINFEEKNKYFQKKEDIVDTQKRY